MNIEKDVPPPPEYHQRARVYPFGDMEVGDSILVKPSCDDVTRHIRARDAAHQYAKRTGFKFRTRADGEGIRIWRVA